MVPIHKVLVPVERRAVGRLREQDDIVARREVFEAELGADLFLWRVVDELFDDGIGKVLAAFLAAHLLPFALGIDVDIAALVAVLWVDGHLV